MSFSIFSVFILSVFAVTAAIEIYRAVHRGAMRTVLSVGSAVLSVIISVLITPVLSGAIAEPIFYSMRRTSAYRSLVNDMGFINSLAKPVITIVISILLFAFVFLAARGIVGVIMSIVMRSKLKKSVKALEPENRKDSWMKRNERTLCILGGVICSFIVTMALTAPIMGVMNVTQDAIHMVESSNKSLLKNEETRELVECVGTYTKDVPGNVFYHLGGKYIFRSVVSARMNGDVVNLVGELETIEGALDNFVYLVPVLKETEEATNTHLKKIDDLCEHIEDMKFGNAVLATYVPLGTEAWLDGNLIFGMSKPSVNKMVNPVLDEVLNVCAESTEANVKGNTITLLKVYKIILQNKELDELSDKSFEEIMDYFEESGFILDLLEVIEENPSMASVKRLAEEIIVKNVVEEINYIKKGTLKYDTLMSELAESISLVKQRGYRTNEEQVGTMAKLLKTHVGDYGLVMSDSMAEYTADVIWDAFVESESVSADDLKQFLKDYSD